MFRLGSMSQEIFLPGDNVYIGCLPKSLISLLLEITAHCPGTLGQVWTVQTPDVNILAYQKLLQSVQTHWAKSEPSRHPISTFLPTRNYCTVSGHIGPSLIHPDTRFQHFCLPEIIAQCPDTLGRVQSIQRPDSNIFAYQKLLHSVQTHWAESELSRHPILTFLPTRNYCKVSGHILQTYIRVNTWFKQYHLVEILFMCSDTFCWVGFRLGNIQLIFSVSFQMSAWSSVWKLYIFCVIVIYRLVIFWLISFLFGCDFDRVRVWQHHYLRARM